MSLKNKELFKEGYKELSQIRVGLKKCNTLQNYNALVESLTEQQASEPNRRNVREEQLSQYLKLLKRLEIQRDELHIRYPEESADDPTAAYGAASQLVNILKGYAESYKNEEIDLIRFKEHSSRVIQTKRNGVLREHRGCKEILTNLLLVLGTLGVGYLLAALFTKSFTPIKCNTKTVNMLNKTEETLDQVVSNEELNI